MRKTSVYLDDADSERLRKLAESEGQSQAEILRAAIAAYAESRGPEREFSLASSWMGDGTSVADVDDGDLLRGFGA